MFPKYSSPARVLRATIVLVGVASLVAGCSWGGPNTTEAGHTSAPAHAETGVVANPFITASPAPPAPSPTPTATLHNGPPTEHAMGPVVLDAAGIPVSYTVVEGDIVSYISTRFGRYIKDLVNDKHVATAWDIYPGEIILLNWNGEIIQPE